jgi:DNA-binding beta-propeller fold protein YncE
MLVVAAGCGKDDSESGENYDRPHDTTKPVIVTNIGPSEGGYGTRVVVSGSNFGNDATKVKLYYNDKEAAIMKLQDNAIYAMTPKQPGDTSVIRVAVEEGRDATGEPIYKEGTLEGLKFVYHIKSNVTTVTGKVGVSALADGFGIDASFGRPSALSCDDEGNLFITDDWGGQAIRYFSVADNKLTTLMRNLDAPYQSTFNTQFTRYYFVERESRSNPLFGYCFSKESNWTEYEALYDQLDNNDNYIYGTDRTCYAIAADDSFIYVMSDYGHKLVRINQESKEVQLIGEELDFQQWPSMAFNIKNGYMYVANDTRGRVYRFDPKHTPAGHTSPWLTYNDMEWIVGTGHGAAIEGNGKDAQIGDINCLCADQEGNIYMADYTNHIIWKIDAENNATVFAGVPGQAGYRDGKPEQALFNRPYDVSATSDGTVYVADTYNYVIRCITIQ